jgi:competence protein ComEC
MRRPMIGVALAVLVGTGVGLSFPFLRGEYLLGFLVLLLLPLLFFLSRSFSSGLIWGLILVASCLNASLSTWSPSERDLARLMRRPAEHVSVVGTVSDDPQFQPGRDDRTTVCRFPLRVEGILRTKEWQKVSGTVMIRMVMARHEKMPTYGDRWHVQGVLKQQSGLRENSPGLYYRMEVSTSTAAFLSAGHGPAWMSWCFQRRQDCREILGRGLEFFPEQAGLLSALLLGYRQDLPMDQYRDFSVTGTMHIFAISGTHVGVLAVFIILLLKSLGIPRPRWILYLAPLLVIFTVATGMASSAVRACIMAVVFWSAGLFERKPEALSALAFSAVLILAAAPAQLFDPGFILSFTAVAGLILLYPVLARPMKEWTEPDPWQLEQERYWMIRFRLSARELFSLAAASWAAWLATTPLTALYFNLFSPIALLANIVVIPAAGLIMLTGCLALIVGGVSLLGAEIFNHANRVFISILLWLIDRVAAVPGGHLFTPSPPGWVMAGWYVSLGLGVMLTSRYRWSLPVAAAGCLALAGFWGFNSDRNAFIDILDVGQGNAALVKVPGRRGMLIDTGSKFNAEHVLRHLRRQGVSRLDALVLSHADREHIGGALKIMTTLPVKEIWCSPFEGRSTIYRQILQEARRRDIRIRRMIRGRTGRLAGGVEWEILDPPDLPFARVADDACLVLRVAREATSVLIMGDAGRAAELRMKRAPLEPSALVLVVGSHGASDATLDDWLEAVSPTLAVISVGSENLLGQPDKEVLETLTRRGIAIYRTDELGSLRISLSAKSCEKEIVLAEAR